MSGLGLIGGGLGSSVLARLVVDQLVASVILVDRSGTVPEGMQVIAMKARSVGFSYRPPAPLPKLPDDCFIEATSCQPIGFIDLRGDPKRREPFYRSLPKYRRAANRRR